MPDLSQFQRELKRLPFIIELPEALRTRVPRLFEEVASGKVFADGETLYNRGSQDKSAGALLVTGSVEIDRGMGDPIIRRAPELFGEMMLLDENSRRMATLTALEESIVFEFTWDDLMEIAAKELTSDQMLDLKYGLVKYAGARFDDLDELRESEEES